jgi:hypothetical protein
MEIKLHHSDKELIKRGFNENFKKLDFMILIYLETHENFPLCL